MNNKHFITTKEYKRFEEFCEACRKYQYIGLCYGIPGVGKTLSAIKYSNWNDIKPIKYNTLYAPAKLKKSKTVLYTAPVVGSANKIRSGIVESVYIVVDNIAAAYYTSYKKSNKDVSINKYEELRFKGIRNAFTKDLLIIIDEADRLKLQALEIIRSLYDENNFGIVLIGMPGIEKKLSRYAQLYSRVGFVHEYKQLKKEELLFIMQRKLSFVGFEHDPNSFVDQEALGAIAQVSRGNFRLLERLLQQISRIMKINQTKVLTKEIVFGARECLVIGQ